MVTVKLAMMTLVTMTLATIAIARITIAAMAMAAMRLVTMAMVAMATTRIGNGNWGNYLVFYAERLFLVFLSLTIIIRDDPAASSYAHILKRKDNEDPHELT